jgi:hypothetical protein
MYGLDAARPAPANKYKRWSDNEVSQLLIAVRKKKTTAEIALALGRENTSILTKLRLLAADYYAEGRTAEEIQRFTGLPERDVARLIKKQVTAAVTADKQAVTADVAADEQADATSDASLSSGAAPSADNTPICEPNPDNSVAEVISSELPGATLVHSDRSGNPTDPDIKTVLAGLLDIQKSVTLLNSKPTMRDLMAVINNIQASLSERC